jgi:hypothetical protein
MGFLVEVFLATRFVLAPGFPGLEIAIGHFSFSSTRPNRDRKRTPLFPRKTSSVASIGATRCS